MTTQVIGMRIYSIDFAGESYLVLAPSKAKVTDWYGKVNVNFYKKVSKRYEYKYKRLPSLY